MLRLIVLASALAVVAHGAVRTVVVTGATGRSGSLIYLDLKTRGVNVRGLVRNTSKAREYSLETHRPWVPRPWFENCIIINQLINGVNEPIRGN